MFEQLCTLDKHAGYQDKAFFTYQILIELSHAKLTLGSKFNDANYDEFCELEYPHIGEMREYYGYLDYLKLKSIDKEDLLLIKAKTDFIKEESNLASIDIFDESFNLS